jgi:hypothetical protein
MDEAERCDGLAFIYRSRLIAHGSPAELKASFTGDLYRVEAAPLLRALQAARSAPGVLDASLFGTGLHGALERGSDPGNSAPGDGGRGCPRHEHHPPAGLAR